MGLKDATAIVGIGQTPFAKHLPESEKTLACRAILAALDDAGIAPSRGRRLRLVHDGGDRRGRGRQGHRRGRRHLLLQGRLRRRRFAARPSPISPPPIATGQASVGVAWRSRKRGSGPAALEEHRRPAAHPRPVDPALRAAAARRRDRHAGPALHARVRRHPRPPLQRRPRLPQPRQPEPRRDHVRPPADPRDVHDRPLDQRAAVPLRQLPGDGRRAGLRHRLRRAGPRLPRTGPCTCTPPPRACPPSTTAWSTTGTTTRSPAPPGPPPGTCGSTPTSGRRTSTSPRSTTRSPRSIPLSLEGYGFCGRGEGGAFTEGGALEIGGRLPLNTGGGGLSEAYVHGFNLITEGVQQLRGTSTAQVPDAATCLVTAGEGVPTSALLLRS